jgi:ectoine hydroxylase-related dioxygenase (phytanoyl-CoA dioxygenase family)
MSVANLFKNGYITFPLGKKYNNDVEVARSITHECCSTDPRLWGISSHDSFCRILSHPTIKRVVKEVYGDNYHITSFSTNTVLTGKLSKWHTDHPYNMGEIPSKHIMLHQKVPLSLQINISLDDFTSNNGATQYIRGSHLYDSVPPNATISNFIVPKGTVMIYLGSLWHCAGLNKTNIPRSVILSNFAPLAVDGFKPNNAQELHNQIRNHDYFVVEHGKVQFKQN